MADAANGHQPHKLQAGALGDDMLHSSRGVPRGKAMLACKSTGRSVPSSALRAQPVPVPCQARHLSPRATHCPPRWCLSQPQRPRPACPAGLSPVFPGLTCGRRAAACCTCSVTARSAGPSPSPAAMPALHIPPALTEMGFLLPPSSSSLEKENQPYPQHPRAPQSP
uniref:Uncharacterized protein n=1 Tax=Junco hyemalis TaxID=40217 RepID=A0A8C5IJ64_JUNHY